MNVCPKIADWKKRSLMDTFRASTFDNFATKDALEPKLNISTNTEAWESGVL